MLTRKEIFKSKGYDVPSFVFDADGKPIEIETSENEEQSLAYDCIVGALVDAGYFRARIRGINPFDVLVGGMTWCLDSSSVDLDVDFLFKEDLNIGQKISLTEKIVVALPRIKCPYFIEPHQIQGLDFIHVLPVIEWLIKWSHENRQRKAKYLEAYALNQYYKTFRDKEGESARRIEQARSQTINFLSEQYQPRRICQQTNRSISDLRLRVESTLAEYGLSDALDKNSVSLGPHTTSLISKEDLEILAKGCQSDISQERLNFEAADRLLGSDFRAINTEKRIRQLKFELENLKKEKERLNDAVEEGIHELEILSNENDTKTAQLEALSEEEQKIVKKIQSMIQIHEKLKDEEKKFKEECKAKLNELMQEISSLENGSTENEIEELRVTAGTLKAKLQNKKMELGKILRTVSAQERLFDQIPSRAELSQYQKRFMELHYQIAVKYTETKRYFILFNTINDKFHYMGKEYNILNSIHDSFFQVVSRQPGMPDTRNEFLRQLRDIASGIEQAKEKITEKRNENRSTRENLSDQLAHLQKMKNDYVNAVKELSDAYRLNEQLEQRLYAHKLRSPKT